MNLIAYTDGRSKGGKLVSVAVLFTETRFIDLLSNSMKGDSSYLAELYGLKLVVDYVYQHREEITSVVVNTDLEPLSSLFHTYRRTKRVPGRAQYREIWREIVNKTKGINMKVKHVPSHQDKHSPNKVCDSLARLLE